MSTRARKSVVHAQRFLAKIASLPPLEQVDAILALLRLRNCMDWKDGEYLAAHTLDFAILEARFNELIADL